jgi:hydantoinase/carbamoylase family amidase
LPDAERIAARLDALWEIAQGPAGGADRPAFSSAEAQAMLLVSGWARQAGLRAGIDQHGNLWALPPDWTGPVVTSGSHVDTVPDGGRYDGALGTVLGLELVHDLRLTTTLSRLELKQRGVDEAGLSPSTLTDQSVKRGEVRPALLVCAAEEAPRFGAGTIGSRLLVGTLDEAALDHLYDAAGVSAAAARAEYLDALDDLPTIQPPLDKLRAHAEVHVAQRRALRELGVVTRVASPRRFEVEFDGQAGHAGEVPMADRRDALAAAAELVLAVERAAGEEPPETVATVGTLEVLPGAVSVIPGRARLGLDVRGISLHSLERLDAAIRAAVDDISTRRGVRADLRLTRDGRPAELDPQLARAALDKAAELGIAAVETWSGAGHDAQHLATLMPSLLLFVPLHGGESHTPGEGADMDEIVRAARLATAVLREAAQTAPL